MEKQLIQNPKDYEASIGETLEMHFKILSLPLLDKWQKDSIIKKLNADEHMKVKSVLDNPGELVVTVEIIKNPFPLVLAITGVITVLAGFFIWGSLDKVYKIIETPQGKLLSTGAIVGIIGAAVGLVLLLRR